MSFSLDHLRILAAVADSGSFTRSAVKLGVTQPTISRAISELERGWGAPLFHRTGRGVELSGLGHEALPRVREILRAADQLNDDLQSYGSAPRGEVAIGVPRSYIPTVITPLFRELTAGRPGIRLRIFEGYSEQIIRWLAEGAVDIGIHSRYFELDEAAEAAGGVRFVLVGAAACGALPAEIPFADLNRFPLVLPAPTNSLRTLFDAVARRERMDLDVVAEADSQTAQHDLVLTGGCWMITESHTARALDPALYSAATIVRPGIGRRVMVAAAQKPLSRAARDVLDRVTTLVARAYPGQS